MSYIQDAETVKGMLLYAVKYPQSAIAQILENPENMQRVADILGLYQIKVPERQRQLVN